MLTHRMGPSLVRVGCSTFSVIMTPGLGSWALHHLALMRGTIQAKMAAIWTMYRLGPATVPQDSSGSITLPWTSVRR